MEFHKKELVEYIEYIGYMWTTGDRDNCTEEIIYTMFAHVHLQPPNFHGIALEDLCKVIHEFYQGHQHDRQLLQHHRQQQEAQGAPAFRNSSLHQIETVLEQAINERRDVGIPLILQALNSNFLSSGTIQAIAKVGTDAWNEAVKEYKNDFARRGIYTLQDIQYDARTKDIIPPRRQWELLAREGVGMGGIQGGAQVPTSAMEVWWGKDRDRKKSHQE
jgi:hypothetical protein